MSNHDFDEDHNYYTQSNRQSQIPDYDVTQQPLSTNLPTLPAFAYRQSQDYSPKRPTIDTNVDRSLANGPLPSRSRASSQLDNSPDPHEFYRQYRDSFIRNTGSVYGGTLDALQADSGNGMTATRLAQRNTPSTSRPNGYTPSPVTSRWSSRFEDRNASSPLADRGSASSSKTGAPNVYIPRGRQTSLQALVNKFNSNPDETPPVPGSKTSSRSTSANSPSANAAPKSFRTRTSIESSQTPQNVTPSRNSMRQTQRLHNAVNRKKENREPPTSAIKSPKDSRRSSTIAAGTFGSLSMSDLNTPAAQKTRRPLFGEILQASANASDPGYGIPDGRRRRGSEGSMHHPSPMFEEEAENLMLKVSPSSPTAWYMGVAPSLDGLDLDKPLPPKSSAMHHRSRSDIGASGRYTMAPLPNTVGKTITVLPPPQEQDSPPQMSPTTTKRTSQSRIPVSTARRMSFTSDSGTSTVSPGPPPGPASGLPHPTGYRRSSNKTGSALPPSVPPKTPDNPSSRSATPRRSPRYRNASPPRQPSPRLPAYISEQAPLKSPPLRSSRPRQPVSAASTAASRARAAANSVEQGSSQKEKPPKKIPEVATVNLAARRQMITRAFTKSMIEREEETRKRLSYFHELKKLEELQAKNSASSSNAHSESDGQPSSDFATPAEELSRAEGGLTIKTQRNDKEESAFLQEDSPTLGTSGFVTTQGVVSEPGSAVTSDTAETFFDESQESPADEKKEYTSSESASQKPPAASSPDRNDHDAPPRIASDKDDGESIQIMLGDSPITERLRAAENFADPDESPIETYDQWQSRTVQSTLERISEQNTPQTDNQAHSSISTTASARDDPPWSPESVSSLLSGNTTLDSESYNTIGRVLDAYYDPGTLSPENRNEIERRLFAQSPGIARAGGWDPSKVTQLYLQKYRKSPDLSAVQKPLNAQSSAEDSSLAFRGQEEGATVKADEREDSGDRPSSKDSTFGGQSRTASLTVPSATMNLNRASLNNAEDWLDTSPSMLYWMTNREAVDTPADEREDSLGTRVPSSTGGLTDLHGRSILPDIPQGGLGILDVAGTSGQPQAFNSIPQPPPMVSEIYTSPSRRSDYLDKPLPSPTRKPVQPRTSSVGQTRTPETVGRAQNGDPSDDTPLTPKRVSAAESSTTELTGIERPSTSSEAPTKASTVSTEQLKKLTRRKHIIKELVDTESSFGQDMTVVVDIYKGTSQVILSSPEDVKALFGNAHDIVTFSMTFLDSLKTSAKSVYKLPKSKRWKSKRDSSATTESTNTDDQSSTGGVDLSDEDRDRMTSIGAAFLENIEEMEKVYTEYLKNHDSANRKLQQLQKLSKVQIWLKECRAYAHDLTTAWDLDSLLVKPVQRVLKYPLLLKELVEVTPDNHPDFIKLDTAARELVGVSKRINEAKKRADLVEQVTGATKTKKKEESRLGLPKAFGRRNEKLKQQVGLVENFQDREYDEVSQKFGSHYFQVQVVMRDVEMYQEMVKRWVGQFVEMASAVDQYIDVNSTTYPELESKWRKFSLVAREMQAVALEDHVCCTLRLMALHTNREFQTDAVKKNVIDPMTSLLKLHDGPQKLMEKRKKRVADFVKYKAIKDRGEKPDKKTIEQGEQFLAVNDTLKIELPKLFSLAGQLIKACLNNLVQLQLQWTSVWKRKMIQAIQLQEVPLSYGVIAQDFAADFRYIEAQVLSLGLCNGSILADAGGLLPFNSSGPSIGGSTLNENGSRRPSLAPEEYRPRTLSNVGNEYPRGRGLSTPGGASPMLPSPDFGRPTDGFGLAPQANANLAQPTTGLRVRASSSASSKSPVTPDIPGGWRHQMNGPPIAGSHAIRPSTSTGRSYGSFSGTAAEGQRYSSDAYNRLRPDGDHPRYMNPRDATHPGQAPVQRHSGIFSSAMPMSDSPRPSSPAEDKLPQDYNVLFLAASVYEFNIDRARREAGYPYLTYVAGEVSYSKSSCVHVC